jgi:polysaccharide biosynthesis transport protein
MTYPPPEHRPQPGDPRSSPYLMPPGTGEAGDFGLPEAFATLRRRWWMLVAGATLFSVGAWYVVPEDVIRYEARTVVRLTDTKRALTGNLDAGQNDNVAASDFLASQIAVIRSRALLADVVQVLGLRLDLPSELRGTAADILLKPDARDDSLRLVASQDGYAVWGRETQTSALYGQPVEIDGLRFTLGSRPAVNEATIRVLPHEAVVDQLLGGLRASARDRSPVLDIAYRHTNPERAQLVVNEITRAFQDHNARGVREQARRRREFIEEQLGQSEIRLREAQDALTAFRSSGNLYSSRDRLLAEQSGLMNLEMRREEMDADRRMLRALLARLDQASTQASEQELRTLVSAPGIASNPVVSQLFSQYVQYETERKRLLADGRSTTHPDVERVTTLVGSTRVEFINAVRSHIASLDARLASLDDLRSRSAATLRQLPAAETAETHLVQEVETVRRMAEMLRDEYQRARIAEAVEMGQVEILDLATFASPVGGAGRGQRLVMALFLGLILGGGGAIVMDRVRPSIRRREEVEELLPVPGLGVIPSLTNGGSYWSAIRTDRRALLSARDRSTGRQVVVNGAYGAPGAEAYRVLRTNLVFSKLTESVRSLVVTSAATGEGKTTTAANLATILARQGQRTLLIDCDLRRPQLHRVFRIAREPGFVELITGQASADEVVHESGTDLLSIVPCGKSDPAAVELLGSARMRRCLEELSRRFDMLIIDAPPVLVAADAAAIGATADGILLVIKAGRTTRNDVRYAFQQLTTVGGRVVGSVLNDPNGAIEGYGSYYAYDYRPAE